MIKRAAAALASGWIGRLRAPWLLALVVLLFVFDVMVPDVLPFVDEVLLGIAGVLLSRWRRPAGGEPADDESHYRSSASR